MKVQDVYEFEEAVVLHSKLKKLGKFYSEQWKVKYNQLQDNGFWKIKEVIYCTENKGVANEVEEQWNKDFKNKHTSLISIHYR